MTDKILIFKAMDDSAAPIGIDERQKFKLIVKETIKQRCVSWFLLPILFSYNVYLLLLTIGMFEMFITSLSVFVLLVYFELVMIISVQIVSFLIWVHRSKIMLKTNGKIFSYNRNDFKRKSKIELISLETIVVLIFFTSLYSFMKGDEISGAFMGVAIISFLALIKFVVRKEAYKEVENVARPLRVSKIAFIAISIIIVAMLIILPLSGSTSKNIVLNYKSVDYIFDVNNDKIPVTLEDFGIKARKFRDKRKEISANVFASLTKYSDSTFSAKAVYMNGGFDLNQYMGFEYEVFESNFDFLVNMYLNKKLSEDKKMIKNDASKYNGKEIYINANKNSRFVFVIVFDKKVICFYSDISLKSDKISLICNKLSPK